MMLTRGPLCDACELKIGILDRVLSLSLPQMFLTLLAQMWEMGAASASFCQQDLCLGPTCPSWSH